MSAKKQKTKGKMLLGLLMAAVCLFSASVGITVGQLPHELTVSRSVAASGKTELSTFLPTQVEYGGSQQAAARLFGLIRLKTLPVRMASPVKVRLGGTLFGVRMYSDGVMVVGLSDFSSEGRSANPAREAGITEGDVIRSVNGRKVYRSAEFSEIAEHADASITLDVLKRDGKLRKITLTPLYSDGDRCLKTGMWVRDSAAGIGTLTYIHPESGAFGGLGHGICDSDTQSIIPVHGGEIVEAEFIDVKRGVKGIAGEIRGWLGTETLGKLSDNTVCGMFGQYTAALPEGDDYEVAMKQEIRTGKAQVLCTVDGSGVPRFYGIEIEKINYNAGEQAKNMIVRVTDEDLLNKTGGIVQGMSGSPIVQDGKLVGAMTHVFVNDPTCGYAIFAENMLRMGG